MNDARAIIDALRSGTRFLVTSHVNPDGDAIGSLLGMKHFLRALGKAEIVCALDDPVPHVYTWLSGADAIVHPASISNSFDTTIVVDANKRERVGSVAEHISSGGTLIFVDHHIADGDDGHVRFVDPSYAAAGEIVAELFEAARVDLTKDAAECLYVALITDTGNFKYANTTPRSHRIAARLLEAGLDVRGITTQVIDSMTPGKFRLLKRVLDRAQFSRDGRFASATILLRDLEDAGALPEDIDGLINYLRNVEGVQLAAVFREAGDGMTKVSFRSVPDINSAELLRHFGGGGHAMAAGATLQSGLDKSVADVVAYIQKQLHIEL